jgi:aminoglycoside 3-N-acetyltransferase
MLLEEARIPGGGVLFVHCSFRRFHEHGFDADRFIDALVTERRGGTLVMPAMSWRIVTPANPVFDELATPSHVGLLAERFRTRFASHRSLHPTHSVSALGPLAAHLTSGHHLEGTPVGLESPYGRATREDAYVLMLGIGLERSTAIHHPEERVAPDIYLQPPEAAEPYELRARDGAVHRMRLRRHLKLNRDFPQFEAPLAEKGRLLRGVLAGTPWLAVSQRDLLAEVTEALERDPRAIIAPPGAPVIP